MPLIANNIVISKNVEEAPKVVPPTSQPVIVQSVRAEQPETPVLIVDGKMKKVSKRSAYLLDMLTIDDE